MASFASKVIQKESDGGILDQELPICLLLQIQGLSDSQGRYNHGDTAKRA